jgi:hypothetical protein
MVPKRKSRKEAKRRRPLSPIEKEMMVFFEREIKKLRADVKSLSPGLARDLANSELQLRVRRLGQWRSNPSGRVSKSKLFRPVKPPNV